MRRVSRQGFLDRLNAIPRRVFSGELSADPFADCYGRVVPPLIPPFSRTGPTSRAWHLPRCFASHLLADPRQRPANISPMRHSPPLLLTQTADFVNTPTRYLRRRTYPPPFFLPTPRAISSDTPFTHQCTWGRLILPTPCGLNTLRDAQPSHSARRSSSCAVRVMRPMRSPHCSAVSQPGGGSWLSDCASTKRAAQSIRLELDWSDEAPVDLADLVKRVCAVIVEDSAGPALAPAQFARLGVNVVHVADAKAAD